MFRHLLHQTLRLLLPLSVVVAGVVVAVPVSAASAAVTVSNNQFTPDEVRIEPGDAVTWTWTADGHSVKADDGSFGSGTLRTGATYTHTFAEPGTFAYHCELHDMRGVVQVGPEVEPPPPIESPRLYVPSTDAPTLEAAVEAASAGTTIVLDPARPHVLAETVVIPQGKDGITITTGTPPAPTETTTTTTSTTSAPEPAKPGRRTGQTTTTSTTTPTTTTTSTTTVPAPQVATVEPGVDLDHAFVVRASRVRIEHLAISGFTVSALHVEDARAVRLEDLTLQDNRDYGIRAVRAHADVLGVTVRGARRAAVSFEACTECGTVDGLDAHASFVGFEAIDAHAFVLRSSRIHGNANGVVAQARGGGAVAAQLYGNLITDNTNVDVEAPTVYDGRIQPAAGVGLWLAGATGAQVWDNEIQGHRWGIVATVLGAPASDNAVTDNTVSRSSQADLAWDGVGTGTCFAGNTATTSRPAAIEDAYPCDGPRGAVAPDAPIAADIVIASLTTYYCRELTAC